MYKIYINNAPLILTTREGMQDYPPSKHRQIKANYLGKSKFFFNYIDLLEKTGPDCEVVIGCRDVVEAFRDFSSLYTIVEAGGGLVVNPAAEVLLIFRRGFWDLPKGKMDPGENILQTAAREVKEETGILHLQTDRHLCTTYHTYRTGKGKRVLKICTWFLMFSQDKVLFAQKEEDIEEASWIDLNSFLDSEKRIFNNIKEVLELYLKLPANQQT
jgi:8-oxo-dGTP pyrophosphatase MutT (NUDIX family)